MIYIGCGVIMFVIGVIWLIAPSPNPNRIYGYMSYLASVNVQDVILLQISVQ